RTGWRVLGVPPEVRIPAFAALAWLACAGGLRWLRLPLVARVAWGERGIVGLYPLAGQWRDVRIAGMYVHYWSGLVMGAGACGAAALAPDAFAAHKGPTE